MARRTVARLVFGIERCSVLCDFDARQSARQNRRCDIGLSLVLTFSIIDTSVLNYMQTSQILADRNTRSLRAT